MSFHKLLFLTVVISFATACSSTHQAYLQSFKLAFETSPDPKVVLEDIKNSEIDLLYVRLGDRPRAVLALAYIESGQYKWVSADNEMLIEKAGRIIKTIGTNDYIRFVGNTDEDPLNTLLDVDCFLTWNRVLEYGKDYQRAHLESKFELVNDAELIIDNKVATTNLVKEFVTFTNKSGDISSWVNLYWYDINTSQLLKSTQQITPYSEKYSLTYVSRIARLPIASVLDTEE